MPPANEASAAWLKLEPSTTGIAARGQIAILHRPVDNLDQRDDEHDRQRTAETNNHRRQRS
jgi:hypothetical protein